MELTKEQQAKLWARGTFVKEKCDRSECPNVIRELSWAGRSHGIYCSRECRDSVQPAGDLKVEHKFVAGLDKVEQAILAFFQEHPKKKVNRGQLFDSFEGRLGSYSVLRQGVWNLLQRGQLVKEGWFLKACTGKKPVSVVGKARKIVSVEDVPVAED